LKQREADTDAENMFRGGCGVLERIARVRQILKERPVIPAIRTGRDITRLFKGAPRCVFVLESSILDLQKNVAQLSEAGHVVFVHVDLVEGLKTDPAGIHYLVDMIAPHGVISTHRTVLEWAKKAGLLRVLRVFLLDSEALRKGRDLAAQSTPDFVEVLPALSVPLLPERMLKEMAVPLIAGGLVTEIGEVHSILKRGAVGVSTSQSVLW
jgi:glycerol uptake operon antiterminator